MWPTAGGGRVRPPRCDRSRGMGHGSETGSEAPMPEQTSFENPQTDVHEATTGRMPGVTEPTIERAIWGEGPGPNPLMASKVFKQTFGHRPSIHQLSHKDGRLDVHPSRGVETAHHGSKTAVRYLCPWLEYLPHKYVRVRFLSKFPGFRQNVKSPKILWYLGESKMTLCEHTWTGKICIFLLSMDIMGTWT